MLNHPFYDQIAKHISERKNAICVGLDPDIEKLPTHLPKSIEGIEIFLKTIIKSTSDKCVAYKANISFFEAYGIEGLQCLKKLRDIIPSSIPYIIDGKRGDIGNTARMQAQFLFEHLGADASTINPYMGFDAVEPFLKYKDKFHFILALTSNPGASHFQKKHLTSGKTLFEEIADSCEIWNDTYKNIGLVVGGTQGELAKLRKRNNLLYLIPGIGTQGGSAVEAFNQGKNKDGLALLNVGRAILYADNTKSFGESARNFFNTL